MKYLQARPDVRLLPPSTLKLDLVPPLVAPTVGRGRSPAPFEAPAAGRRTMRAGPEGAAVAGGTAAAPPPRAARSEAPVSWWTVRATAGEVTAGFSKQEILKPVAEDPRVPGGLFDRVGGLLAALDELR
jgi:hypothetical protein